MSLIDLPGMTRIPVKGQPDDIADRLERLIMSYIRNPSCIILAVSAANTDLANSDAIAMSRAVDPEGLRTIGAHLFSPTLPTGNLRPHQSKHGHMEATYKLLQHGAEALQPPAEHHRAAAACPAQQPHTRACLYHPMLLWEAIPGDTV